MPIGWLWAFLVLGTLWNFGEPAHADTVYLRGGGAIVGRVETLDRQAVSFLEGCGTGTQSISWDTVLRLDVDEHCTPSPRVASAPLFTGGCVEDRFSAFSVTFRDQAPPVIAENIGLTKDRVFHLDLFEPWTQAHGPIGHVQQIAKLTVCRDDLKSQAKLPTEFCREPRQVAVAFDYKAPLSNRILTNGFSFYIRISGKKPDDFDIDMFRREVRSAFQNGLSLWTSALQDRQHLLTEPVRRFLETRISRSASGYVLLIPPQVIELSCPHSATFVVDLSFGNRFLFPRPPLVLAKAQTEGRTVALNVLDIPCYRTQLRFDEKKQLSFELDGGCLNLVPIMTHELGHAFGIKHIDDPLTHALMDSRFSRDALIPTDRDVIEFVAVLDRSVVGSAPGEITMVTSDGVRPPSDFVECLAGDASKDARGC